MTLQQPLEQAFGLFTVARHCLASGRGVRITPQVFNTPHQMQLLVAPLQRPG